ncbi:hypothetical protein ATE92_1532 [Ulvibacter sp. MAR_2010_11]|uniref:hypothetical protein n=1 Tax=Ulvibacter sp. MAR_2010_11 TaxID=1250229 RepID=UPI000CC87227|nr:hypothetical protein [Ulvibacter sp. MAR_2010_11]PKA83380.1 hypothetical protein ATE92_1532 [Ulvibacter sp. MAR_2010_11]
MKNTCSVPSYYFTCILFLLFLGKVATAQVGINTVSPDPSSVLDINSSNKGLLIPRVNIANLNDFAPITGGIIESLLVYNTNSSLGKGFYYWTGSNWQSISNGWKTSGNTETNDTFNFIGTLDNNNLVFKTNNLEAMRINASNRQVVIGQPEITGEEDLLRVFGDIELGGGSSNFDAISENIQLTAQTQQWNINVKNDINSETSNFYIGTGEAATDAGLMIAPNGNVKIGKSGDVSPLSELHIANDQANNATTMRLDNTVSYTNRPHTSYELWDGNTYLKGFFRHNNYTNVLDLGHNQGNGVLNFYSGNGTTSANPSAIAMTLDSQGDLNVVNNVHIGGNLSVDGTISKAGGTFKIDHPLDPTNKYLYHSFVESPDMMNIYNGNVTTDENGEAVVIMPDYFSALNIDFRYQLTTIGSFSKVMIAEEISGNTFVIKSEEPNVKISWQVTGVRNDAYAQKNRVKVEVEKEDSLKGTYLYPEVLDKK